MFCRLGVSRRCPIYIACPFAKTFTMVDAFAGKAELSQAYRLDPQVTHGFRKNQGFLQT